MERQLQDFKNQTFLVLRYDEADKWIYTTWNGLITMNDVKKGSIACLEMLEETKATIIINDSRKLLSQWDSINKWLEKEWIPSAMESGLECLAQIVNPVHIPIKESSLLFKKKAESNFRTEIFYDIETAKRWIHNHDCRD